MHRDAGGPGSAAAPAAEAESIARAESILWALMERFERLAVDCYARHAPRLAVAEKLRFCDRLDALDARPEALSSSDLARPVEELLSRARSADERATLIVQGLVLENLGQAIYRIAARNQTASPATRELAALGWEACAAVTAVAGARIAEIEGTPDARYAAFADGSYDVLAGLDALAGPVDQVFGARFGLRFADVLGEFAADLITSCTGLGMQRRKVVAHLAGACMGL